jgi:hypothetical protein
LWGFRAAQHVRCKRLDYQETWKALRDAALRGGAKESWVYKALFHAFANAQMFKVEPSELQMLEAAQ